jgi:5-methylcytosine-specific restriction endonuclease McrA
MQMYHQSDKHQQWKREYRKTPRCRELDRQRAKRYAAKYPEKKKRYNSRWAKENRPYTRAAKSKRRALLANAPGAHTCDSTRRQYDQQDGRCYWCSEPLNGDYHEDHVVPLSRGGSNWSINIVCACSWCNLSKHNKLPYIEWQPPCPLEIF